MDPARKKRRNGVLILVTVLLVVCAWWLLWAPHTRPYKAYKTKSQLRAILQAIKPPAGCKHGDIGIQHVGNAWIALELYAADPSLEDAKAHYLQEFTRRGFTYRGEKITDKSQSLESQSLEFSAPGYDAVVSLRKLDSNTAAYSITLVAIDLPR